MSQVGAFFDVDRTLVSCNTGRLFLRDLRRRGEISFLRALRALGWMAKYHLSLIDLQRVAARLAGPDARAGSSATSPSAAALGRGRGPAAAAARRPAARSSSHRAEGHVLAILSSSPTYVTRPIAETLGIEEVISTQFEVADGAFTGRLVGPGLRRPGQGPLGRGPGARRLESTWRRAGSTPTPTPTCRCWSGSGNRVVVNPDPRLRRAAKQRGWPVQDWSRRDRASEIRA